ncbi:MAG TPA: non-ribosomal peptide synthetase, partial [Candidatus Nanopelagicales bacterium]|nr:non-ribosomal peptide synthetase [Candidatus Nanopelagicales bacterium]
ILKAGGAYVPLDPEHPEERLALMLRDSGAPVLLARATWAARLAFDGKVVEFTSVLRPGDDLLDERPARRDATPESLAYITFTSGSTGRPKGVAVPHRAVVRLVMGTDYVKLTPASRVMHASNLSFDASTFEIWGALLNGARVCVVMKEALVAHDALAARIREEGITAMFLTTAVFQQMASAAPEAFRDVDDLTMGGEVLHPGACRAVLAKGPPKRLTHVYGPTENTTFSTAHRVTCVPPGAASIPIGRPIANSTAYILDAHLQPVPIGVPGEIYVGGDGLARGYVNRPELTAERFVESPLPEVPGVRLYRTGDRGRFLPDGSIDFLGRTDRQVKIRGFRIEPGEVEIALRDHPDVRDATVQVREGAAGDRRLIAYVVPRSEPGPGSDALRRALRSCLPEYMIPSAFVFMGALPLTPNGKVDHAALPSQGAAEPDSRSDRAVPGTAIEQALVEIWQEVLGVAQIGIDDPFFDVGGHSLLLAQVRARIRERLGLELDMLTLFQRSTIRKLAAHLSGAVHGGAPA